MSPKDSFIVAGFKSLWWLGRFVPLAIMRTTFRVFAAGLYLANGAGIRCLKFAIARVINQPPTSNQTKHTARNALLNYFTYWAEMFCLPQLLTRDWSELVELHGLEAADELFESGKGVLVVSTHSGNWDLVGTWAAHYFGGLTAVAERLNPVELFDIFVKTRSQYQIKVIPHRGSATSPIDLLEQDIRSGRVCALVADRDMSKQGIPVQFFGYQTKMPAGPAKLAIDTGCHLVPINAWYEGGKTHIEFHPPLLNRSSVESLTQDMARAFESILRDHPENWFMLQPVWLDQPKVWGGKA